MKSYTITVNGNVYDVTVEETGSTPSAASAPRRAAAPAPAAAPAAQPSAGAGNVKIEAGAAGKVFKIEKKVGDAVKSGDTVLILEIMKMFIPFYLRHCIICRAVINKNKLKVLITLMKKRIKTTLNIFAYIIAGNDY